MLARYLLVRLRERSRACGFFASIIVSIFDILYCIMPIVMRAFHRIPEASAPDDAGRVSGHIHFFVPARVRGLLAGLRRLGHSEVLFHPAFFNVPVPGVTNLDCKQCEIRISRAVRKPVLGGRRPKLLHLCKVVDTHQENACQRFVPCSY